MINQDVKTFVKQTLECACPDEIFHYIDHQREFRLSDTLLLTHKINIGHRLLIYVIKTADPDFIKSNLSTLIHTGKAERDRIGLNRFRLVIATDKHHDICQAVNTILKTFKTRDEKIHVHVVDSNQVTI